MQLTKRYTLCCQVQVHPIGKEMTANLICQHPAQNATGGLWGNRYPLADSVSKSKTRVNFEIKADFSYYQQGFQTVPVPVCLIYTVHFEVGASYCLIWRVKQRHQCFAQYKKLCTPMGKRCLLWTLEVTDCGKGEQKWYKIHVGTRTDLLHPIPSVGVVRNSVSSIFLFQ